MIALHISSRYITTCGTSLFVRHSLRHQNCLSNAVLVIKCRFVTYNRDMREMVAAGASQPIAGLQQHAQAPFLSAAVNPARPATLLVYNHDALCHIDLDTAVPTHATMHRTGAAHVPVAPSNSSNHSVSSSKALRKSKSSKSKDKHSVSATSDSSKKRKRQRPEVFTDVVGDVADKSSNAAVASSSVAAVSAAAVPAAAAAAVPEEETEDTDEATMTAAAAAAAAVPAVVQNGNFTLCLRFRPLLHVDFLGPNEMVIVECPWSKIVASMPDTLYRQRYGT
jgi:hypothetical protein